MTLEELEQTLADVKAGLIKNKEAVSPVLPKADQLIAKIHLNPTLLTTAVQLLGGTVDDAMDYLKSVDKIFEIEHKLIDGPMTDNLIKIIDFLAARKAILWMIASFIKGENDGEDQVGDNQSETPQT